MAGIESWLPIHMYQPSLRFQRIHILPMFTYQAYGLHILSEVPCPELHAEDGLAFPPDVTIRLEPPVAEVSLSIGEDYFQVSPGLFHLTIPKVARYTVKDGNSISIQPQAGTPIDQVRLFMLGSSMGALLYQRGLFPLHGSAVSTRWGAMIFVGPQGMGKSTLAAHFLRRGYSLLSDDVCAIVPSADQVRVLPALAQVRLCEDAYSRLGQPADAQFNVDKFVVPVRHAYCRQSAPLRAIHLLENQEEDHPQFSPIRGFDRIRCLLENLYRPEYLKGQSTQNDLLRMAGSIAQQTEVIQASRRRDPQKIDDFIDFLELAWEQKFGTFQEQAQNQCAPLKQATR